jgi:hypothetical protein
MSLLVSVQYHDTGSRHMEVKSTPQTFAGHLDMLLESEAPRTLLCATLGRQSFLNRFSPLIFSPLGSIFPSAAGENCFILRSLTAFAPNDCRFFLAS